MMNPNEKYMESKREEEEEGDDHEVKSKLLMTPSSSSSSRQWTSSLKNPRIVRVSRSHGGKDRHSKVCTVRGLRDRRIRLSVQTAIQLYDLQERLGLSQPSKVIDWLMDATQHEIDKLPPLPMLPSNFFHNYFDQQQSADHHNTTIMSNIIQPESYMDHHPILSQNFYKNEDQESGFGGFVAQISAHNFFPLNSQFSAPNMPFNSNYFQLETPPNLSLSQFGGGFSFSDRAETYDNDQQQMRSSAAAASTSYTPIFPPYLAAPPLENHSVVMPATLHLINSSSPIKSFSFNPSLHSSQNDVGEEDEQH